MSRNDLFLKETGSALLLALVALLLMSLLGLYMTLNANTGVRISDNYESQIQATYAALAGLNHARILVRGIDFDDLLQGPDGSYSTNSSYLTQAKGFAFRNPVDLSTALSLDISGPLLGANPDDGLISTGFFGGLNGMVLIPGTGIGLSSPNPYGPGNILSSRYFVKITDNSGESPETRGDPGDNPFVDGDGTVIARSVGVSRTFSEWTGLVRRLNSIAVFEARFKRLTAFDTGPAVVVLGSDVNAAFAGDCLISGDLSAGIGTIDTNLGDGIFPEQAIRMAAAGVGSITGGGLPDPSVEDITSRIASNPDRAPLLRADFLWDFIRNRAPKFADGYFEGDQYWLGAGDPYTGFYDISKKWNAPGQDPKITVVNGDLHVAGSFSGGGLIIITGSFFCSGPYEYNGLVVAAGSGTVAADGSGPGIQGGLIVARLIEQGGGIVFGTPGLSIAGTSRFV